MESTIRTIRGSLDESASSALLYHMNFASPVSAEQIHERMHRILESGAIVLERKIVAELYDRLNLTYSERSSFDFEKMTADGLARL